MPNSTAIIAYPQAHRMPVSRGVHSAAWALILGRRDADPTSRHYGSAPDFSRACRDGLGSSAQEDVPVGILCLLAATHR
jgi:hypothetical protein